MKLLILDFQKTESGTWNRKAFERCR